MIERACYHVNAKTIRRMVRFKGYEMTSDYMSEKGEPGFDQILRAPWSGLG
jgi:hypothetical protein